VDLINDPSAQAVRGLDNSRLISELANTATETPRTTTLTTPVSKKARKIALATPAGNSSGAVVDWTWSNCLDFRNAHVVILPASDLAIA
jgi:hypothetical protein